MATRSCAAPSPGKRWTITSTETRKTKSKYSERTARPSSRKYGGGILLGTPNWTGPFSFARVIYLTLNDRGMLHSQQNGIEEAWKEYEEALKIDRQQVQKNTETYLPDAMMLNNLEMLHSRQNGIEEARKEHEKALEIDRQQAQKNPETYLPDAIMLNNPEMLHSRQTGWWRPGRNTRKRWRSIASRHRRIDRRLCQA